MASMAASTVVRQLRRAVLAHDAASLTDGELLQAFVSRRDQTAFEALVHRHGTMVLNVCRRVLRNEADADDAFQATFLVLVRKAAAIRSPSAVSSWLYGVAHTTALKAKAMNRKRRERELEAGMLPRAQACEEVWRAVQALLDAELASLPEKYRSAIVLCDLECKTIKEAARLRNCPQGTIATRLARGRALLARRLAKHGITVSATVLTGALAHGATAASLPPALVLSTIKATSLCAAGQAATGIVSAKVAALTQGVVQAMFLTKLKLFAAGLVAVTVLGAGVGAIGPGIAAQDAASPFRTTQQPLPTGKAVQAAGGDANLKQEVERLRAELEQTRLELLQSRLENAQLKAHAEVAAAQARLGEAQAEAALRKAREEALKGQQNKLGAGTTNPFGTGKPGAGTSSSTPSPEKPLPSPAKEYIDSIKYANEAARRLHAEILRKAQDEPAKGLIPSTPPQKPAAGPSPTPSAVSPDGRSVAIANDMTIIILDVQTDKVLFKAQAARSTSLAFSPDGKLLVSAGQKAITFWDPATGKQIRALGVPNPVTSLRFSGDARLIIIVESDRTQREFDAATGKELRVIRPDQEKRP